jgi:hypothetical protein
MKKTLSLTLATIAIAAMVAGISTNGSVQVAQATHKDGHEVGSGPGTPGGTTATPYGQAVSNEAQTGEGGFGQDIKDCREANFPGCNEEVEGNNGIGDARASDEAGKVPGKAIPTPTRDELAGNPAN